MNPVTQTLIKIAFLAMLWLFVIAAVGVMRADLFGSKSPVKPKARPAKRPRPVQQPPVPQMQPMQPPPQQYGGGSGGGSGGGPGKLVVTEGPRAGTTIDLGEYPVTIGRANDATLVVVDDYASSRHARIFAQDGQWIVEDLGSTNGTYLGRTRLTQPTPLPPGVPIRIGKTVLELRK
jgi:pSer/pThr/pTyr-binding forkhead associated (FHA) protein